MSSCVLLFNRCSFYFVWWKYPYKSVSVTPGDHAGHTMKTCLTFWCCFVPGIFSSEISTRMIKTDNLFICCIKQHDQTAETSVKQWQKRCRLLRVRKSSTCNVAIWPLGGGMVLESDWNQCSYTFLFHKGGDVQRLWSGKSPYINSPTSAIWKTKLYTPLL